MTDRNFVGLDYHMGSIQVSVMDRRGRELANRRCANDWHAVVETAQRHGPVARAAIESCVGAANLAEQLVSGAGWSVDLAHPGYVARMKQTPDKSDWFRVSRTHLPRSASGPELLYIASGLDELLTRVRTTLSSGVKRALQAFKPRPEPFASKKEAAE